MTTLAVMRARIANDINRTDFSTQIDLAINRAIKFYYRSQRFWFNETTGTFNTVANQINYGSADGVPTDIQEIDNVKIEIATTNNPNLTPRTYEYIQARNIANVPAVPTEYAIYQENFYLYPIPNAIYEVTVSYAKSYADLSADGDSNDFTNNAEDLIEARATWWIYRRLLKNYEAAADAKQEELDALYALQSMTNRYVKSGKLSPVSF